MSLINKSIPVLDTKKTGILEQYNNLKNTVKNDELEKIDEFNIQIKNKLKKLEEDYKEHI